MALKWHHWNGKQKTQSIPYDVNHILRQNCCWCSCNVGHSLKQDTCSNIFDISDISPKSDFIQFDASEGLPGSSKIFYWYEKSFRIDSAVVPQSAKISLVWRHKNVKWSDVTVHYSKAYGYQQKGCQSSALLALSVEISRITACVRHKRSVMRKIFHVVASSWSSFMARNIFMAMNISHKTLKLDAHTCNVRSMRSVIYINSFK